MENTVFIENLLTKIEKIREDEFLLNDYHYQEKVLPKKIINENSIEFKNFQSSLQKRSSQSKIKRTGMKKKEFDTTNTDVDIIADDIFKNDEVEEISCEKLDISTLERSEKLALIHDYMKRKTIVMTPEQLQKIEEIVDNPDIQLRKYINISKTYQEVTKVLFIKKMEDGSYGIDMDETKIKKVKKSFFK